MKLSIVLIGGGNKGYFTSHDPVPDEGVEVAVPFSDGSVIVGGTAVNVTGGAFRLPPGVVSANGSDVRLVDRTGDCVKRYDCERLIRIGYGGKEIVPEGFRAENVVAALALRIAEYENCMKEMKREIADLKSHVYGKKLFSAKKEDVV